MLLFLSLLLVFTLASAVHEMSVKDTRVFVPSNPKQECQDMGDLQSLSNIAPKLNALFDSSPKCVYFPPGLYMSSDIHPSSGLTMYLEVGATIRTIVGVTQKALINAKNIERFGIIGEGMLHGNAENMWNGYSEIDNRMSPRTDVTRPYIVYMEGVNGALIQDIHIHNSSFFNIHMYQSRNVRIDNVEIFGDEQFPNNDGIDPDASQNITIVNSRISVSDDGICPKAWPNSGPLSNLFVQNITIRSTSHGIKFGSDPCTEMHDVLFDRIKIHDSNSGLAIQMRCNGSVHDITWSNIDIETRYRGPRWWGNGEPIAITAEPRVTLPLPTNVGYIYNLRFINITARSENGAFVSGKTHGLYGLYFENVSVTLDQWTNFSAPGVTTKCLNAEDALLYPSNAPTYTDCRGSIDRRPSLGTEVYSARFPAKAVPFRFENVKGLKLNGVTGRYEKLSGARPSYWSDGGCFDMIDVELDGEQNALCMDHMRDAIE